jgi:hypothetical protein
MNLLSPFATGAKGAASWLHENFDKIYDTAGNAGFWSGQAGNILGGKILPRLGTASGLFTGGVDMYRGIQEIRGGDAVGGSIDVGAAATSFAGGMIRDKAIQSGNPVGYLAGANMVLYSNVAKAAKEVDWSPSGVSAILHASPSDWAGALKEATPTALKMGFDAFNPLGWL